MGYLTPERIEEWREEAQFQHDRYQRDGTGIGTVLALTQARLLRALTELSSLDGTDGCSATARSEALVSTRSAGAEPSMAGRGSARDSSNRRGPRRTSWCTAHRRHF
ncbi:MAG: hypothetical protein ABSF33_02450 [Acidimicrobiales bacterium]|jgi:hypothetical protein